MPHCLMTRVDWFSATHRLYNDKLSPEENEDYFGKCANKNGHGHNYKLEVTVCNNIDPVSGMVMNLKDLKNAIQKAVLDQLDHKNIDMDVDFFQTTKTVSTAENITVFIWNELLKFIPQGILYEVKLHETKKNIFTYNGDHIVIRPHSYTN
ncbi:unnamed protein product [Schistocephalus solidus]|uniref:6-pyruvoyltetrahydropterin synthase n=1 Tax=Schistocephalus solidus TaxID=70667 RepID=A0A183S763_SCHSO|nr:unnamed protein product [Schistocephalus solidus]